MNNGIVGTVATGMVLIAATYVGLKYASGFFAISGGSPDKNKNDPTYNPSGGIAYNFAKFARVAQGQ